MPLWGRAGLSQIVAHLQRSLAWLSADRSLATAQRAQALASWRSLMIVAAVATLARLLLYIAYAQAYGGFDAICHWDCGWFVQTIEGGYDTAPRGLGHNLGQANWPFFPAYVLLARAVTVMLGVTALHGAVITSVLATFGFLTVSLRYLQLTRGAISPWLWVLVALFFPYSFYMSSGYSESLFLLLSTAALYAFMRRQPYRAATLVALSTATRAVGVALVAIVIVERLGFALRAWRERRGVAMLDGLADSLLPIAIAPLGIAVFMAYLHHTTGDALGFSHILAGWGRYADPPWHNLLKGLGQWDFRDLPRRSHTLSAMGALAGLGATAYLAARRRPIEASFCLVATLIPLSTGLESMPRYVSGTPVFLFALFDIVRSIRRAWLRRLIVAMSAALHILLLSYWYHGDHFLT
jgi:hypothetical protein